MKLEDLSIKSIQQGLKKKAFSALEITEGYLERIGKIDKKINAYITVCESQAKETAKKIDRLISNNQPLPPLAGVPMAVKDMFSTMDIRTTAASKILENYIPPYDATCISKLKEAGAIILGKTNHDEFAHGSSGENSAYGSTKNPYDLSRVPGGSSSGSAAAVAAQMATFATGTDTGSSIRLPAAFCNVVGLKPTYGRVSRYGVIAMASSTDCPGPIARTVEDLASVLEVMAGGDPKDATCPNVPVPSYGKSLEKEIKGLKVGIPKELFSEGIDKRVLELTYKAISKLEEQGAKTVEVSLPHTEYGLAVYYIIVPSEISANLARYDGIRFGGKRGKFGDEAKRRIMMGTYALSSGYYDQYYNNACRVRELIRDDFAKVFQKVDVLAAPVSPTFPWKLGEKVNDPVKMYLSDIFMVTANLAGVPSISVPCGFADGPSTSHSAASSGRVGSGQGLPTGLQIMANHFEEEKILKVADCYQKVTSWHKTFPKV
jgi:aspartyl-tRNA(Asn)/glutamyl-tRNA(Gln) amidotransferase subunit A